MARITTIPATRPLHGDIPLMAQKVMPKKRVAAYCRVSTDSEEQATSYDEQVRYYTDLINNDPQWELAGIFTDDGISGTNTKKREGFNKMIESCMAGNIDIIITKSISRFARNTVDCLKYIRMLKEKGVEIRFEKENIRTFDSQGEIMITIMASLAQQESESLSKNVKMGLKFRYQRGKISINHNWFLGYTKDEEGNLVIDPEQAEIVKRIYREYLDGSSMDQIKAGLERDGIKNGAGRKKWGTTNIRQILTNEKYVGDAMLQKTITVDVLNKTRIPNDGREVQYYIEDHHEPIVSRAVFSRVQDELKRRAELKKAKRSYNRKYGLSNVCCCGNCGSAMHRIHWYIGDKKVVWRCRNRMDNGVDACDMKSIDNRAIEGAVVQAVNKLLKERNDVIKKVKANILKVVGSGRNSLTETLDKRITDLEKQVVDAVKGGKKYSNLLEKIDGLKAERDRMLKSDAECRKEGERLSGIMAFLKSQADEIKEYDDKLTRRLIDKVEVFDNSLKITFRHGQMVEIDI